MAGRPRGGSALHEKKDDDKSIEPNIITTPEPEPSSDKEEIREAISVMLSQNLKNLPQWLEEIGKSDPTKALGIFKDFAEYVLPKQQRTDSKQGSDQAVTVVFDFASTEDKKEHRTEINIATKPKKNNLLDELLDK